MGIYDGNVDQFANPRLTDAVKQLTFWFHYFSSTCHLSGVIFAIYHQKVPKFYRFALKTIQKKRRFLP